MRIESITEVVPNSKYSVDLVPTWLERLFGLGPTTEVYKDSGETYKNNNSTVYNKPDGTQTFNGYWIAETIDKFRRAKKLLKQHNNEKTITDCSTTATIDLLWRCYKQFRMPEECRGRVPKRDDT